MVSVSAASSCERTNFERASPVALWEAVCAMCHGPTGSALSKFVHSHDAAALTQTIAYGTANPKMPGFSSLMGGPLNEAQVASLVRFLRSFPPEAR